MAFREHLVRFGLLCALVASPILVAAQPRLDTAAKERLVQLLTEAEQSLNEKRYQEAIDKLTEADKILPAPTVKLEIARARAKLGQILEAQRLMQDIARATPSKGERAEWMKARQVAEQEAAALTARLAIVELRVEGLPQDVAPELLWDGSALSSAFVNMPRPVNPGAHTLKVSARGFVPIDKTVTLQEGESQRIRLAMQPVPPPPPVASSSASLPPPPPPATSTKPPPSPLVSTLLPLAPPTASEASSSNWMTPVGLASLGVFVVAGGVLGGLALSKTSTVKSACQTPTTCPPSVQPDIDRAKLFGTLSSISFVLGGAGGALALYGVLRSDKPSTEVSIGPASLQLRGSF